MLARHPQDILVKIQDAVPGRHAQFSFLAMSIAIVFHDGPEPLHRSVVYWFWSPDTLTLYDLRSSSWYCTYSNGFQILWMQFREFATCERLHLSCIWSLKEYGPGWKFESSISRTADLKRLAIHLTWSRRYFKDQLGNQLRAIWTDFVLCRSVLPFGEANK